MERYVGKHSQKTVAPSWANGRAFSVTAGVFLLVALVAVMYFGTRDMSPVIKRVGGANVKQAMATGTVDIEVEEEKGWELIDYENPKNRVIPKPLPEIPEEASKKEVAAILSKHQDQILEYAKHDPNILTYVLNNYGYPEDQTPDVEELKRDLKLRKETFYKLEGMVRSADYKPGKIEGGYYYNDGMTSSGQRTTTPTNYGSKGKNVVYVTYANGEKGAYSPVCLNFQHIAPPKGYKIERPVGPKPTPKDKKRRDQAPIKKPGKPPINKYPWTTPHHPDNPYTQPPKENVAPPTKNVVPGKPEEVRQGQDNNADTPGGVEGGRTGERGGGTDNPDGSNSPSPPPTTPPDTTDDGLNEGDPGGF